MAGDLITEMPKHKPQKKESESTNFNEGDLSSNGEKNEIKQENFQVDELAGAASKKEEKNIFLVNGNIPSHLNHIVGD